MKILIIEDEAPAFRRLQKILEEVAPQAELLEVIDSVEESVKWLNNHHAPDLIFMDIQLSDGLSFEIFEKVKITRPVIFTTAFEDYTLRAFKVNSIDYLLKPIRKEDLAQSLKKYHELRGAFANGGINLTEVVRQIRLEEKSYKTRFLVKQGDRMIAVETDHIAYFQLRNGVVLLVTADNRKFIMDYSLDEVQNQLDPVRFYRANRQFIVQVSAIVQVHKYHKGKLLIETRPVAEEDLIVSAEKAREFKEWLGG